MCIPIEGEKQADQSADIGPNEYSSGNSSDV